MSQYHLVGAETVKTNNMKHPLALLMNDLHVSKDNIAEFQKNWDEALDLCKKFKIEDICIGGDVFTARAAQTLSVLLTIKKCFLKAHENGIYLTIAEGNHDLVNQELIEGYNSLFSPYPGVEIVGDFRVLQWEDCDYALAMMSYFPERGSFKKRLDELKDMLNHDSISLSETILYIHEEIDGCLGNFHTDSSCPQDWFDGFKSVLVGHIHNRIFLDGSSIEYIGSSRQNSFGEDEEKGYTILFDDGSYEFVKNEVNVRYKNIDVDFADIDDLEAENDERYKVKVRVHCTDAQSKLVDKKMLLNVANKVELITEKTKAAAINESGINVKFDKNGIKSEYVDFCAEKGIDSKLGIEYLNKIN